MMDKLIIGKDFITRQYHFLNLWEIKALKN